MRGASAKPLQAAAVVNLCATTRLGFSDTNQEFDGSNVCQCKSGFTATGVAALSGIKCIADARMTALNVYSETRVTFLDVLTSAGVTTTATVDPSLTLKDLYIPAAAGCFNWADGALYSVRRAASVLSRC